MKAKGVDYSIEYYRRRFREPAPPWVWKLLGKTLRVFMPTIREPETTALITALWNGTSIGATCPPRVAAAALGHFAALCVMEKGHSLPPSADKDCFNGALADAQTGLIKWSSLAAQELVRLPMEGAKESVNAFAAAFSQTMQENGQFCGETNNWRSDATMLLLWPFVEQLDSIADLHRFLQRQIGQKRAGELKRLEALCRSIGLKYRSRGKPPRYS